MCAAGRHGRVPLTSVARLIRPRWPCNFAHPSPRLWPHSHGPKHRTRDDLLGILPKSHPACVGPAVRPSAARVAETTPCGAFITEAVAFRQMPESFYSSPPVAPPPSRLVPTCLSAGSTLRQASTDRAGASLGCRRHGRTCGPTFLGVPLHAVCASHWRRGAPEPLRLVRCAPAWPGPAHFGRTNCSKCPTGLVGQKYESIPSFSLSVSCINP